MSEYLVTVSVSKNSSGQSHEEEIYVEADTEEKAEEQAESEMDKHYPDSVNTSTKTFKLGK